MFCFHQPDVEPAGLNPKTHPQTSAVTEVWREILRQWLRDRIFKDSQQSYDFCNKYQESKPRFWRTILLLLLSSVIPKFRIAFFTYTHVCVFVHVCIYIYTHLKIPIFRGTYCASYMKSRNSTQEFWQQPWQKQYTTSWERDGTKMPPKRTR